MKIKVEKVTKKTVVRSEVWLVAEKMRKRNLAIQGNKKTKIKIK